MGHTLHACILPECQIATQKGVQGRDLTSFLSQVECFANRNHLPLYVFRRDQRKGFDRLEPEGFYDAIRAYGLPEALADLDRSSQENVPYQVKTIHGLIDSFFVTGVTKQGNPLSPVKSTLTTSMGSHWLADCLRADDTVTFMSQQGRRGHPHTPDDRARLRIVMAEAMDDSVLITSSLPAARAACLHMERFQGAYGWETNWDKPLLTVYNVPATPPRLLMPSIDLADPLAQAPVDRTVHVVTQHCDFLRVMVNDPDMQFDKIRMLITTFELPNLHTRLPLTAVRRILIQCLVSRIRPYLSYQPVTRPQAELLDHLLAQRVHEYFGFPFRFNSKLLSLPLSLLGFDFPCISRLNDASAIQGLLRDLNHHVPAFRTLARITLADWTCQLNNCACPLQAHSPRSFNRSRHSIPAAWITAHQALRESGLSIMLTDKSHLFTGDVALRHVARTALASPHTPDSHMITNLERAGVLRLADVATWHSATPMHPDFMRSSPLSTVPTVLQPFAAARDWPQLSQWLSSLTFRSLLHGDLGRPTDARQPHGDELWTLALPRTLRQSLLEDLLLAAAQISPIPPLDARTFADTIVADGSMIARSVTTRPANHVTFAVTSPVSSFVCAVAPSAPTASSLHGEVYGLIAAALHAMHSAAFTSPILYTDHLNSVRYLENVRNTPTDGYCPAITAGCLYRWLLDILARSRTPPRVTYTPAHTAARSIPARANRVVDYLASSSHAAATPPIAVPLPTFSLPDYCLYSARDGFIESNVQAYIIHTLATRTAADPDFRPSTTLCLPVYNPLPPPAHPYLRASSAYSPLVQLYARCGQLDTALTRFTRFGDIAPWCRFGCSVFETTHHVFAHCPTFASLRALALSSLRTEVAGLLATAESPATLTSSLLRTTSALFEDDADTWPQYATRYYLGTMPPTSFEEALSLADRRVVSSVCNAWHAASIRLAGRIWGDYKRRIRPRELPSLREPPVLPPHLSHLTVSSP